MNTASLEQSLEADVGTDDLEEGFEAKTEPEIITLGADDPDHPLNFSFSRKMFQSVVVSLMTMSVAFSSSIYSGALPTVERIYEPIVLEVAVLGIALYTLGFTFGPPIWGPISEIFGRNRVYWPAYFLFLLSQFLVGFAAYPSLPGDINRGISMIMVGRFLEGFFGSVMLVLVVASIGDMWSPQARGYLTAGGVSMIFASPALGPIVGSYLTDRIRPEDTRSYYSGWRWTTWLICIYGGSLWICSLFMKETYVPVLLKNRVDRLRAAGKHVINPLELKKITAGDIVTKYLVRPWLMLAKEPALLFISLYTAIGYSLLYSFLLAYSYVFQTLRGIVHTEATLPLIGVMIGVFIGSMTVMLMNPRTIRRFAQLGHPDPEKRLEVMCSGAIALPIGLFMFAWTAPFRSIHWSVPSVAGIIMGYGIITIFIPAMLYCVDAYGPYAASAVAGNAMSRALLATAFTMFSVPMFRRLTIQGSFSLLGGIAILAMPGPFLIIRYGARLRKRGTYGMTYEKS